LTLPPPQAYKEASSVLSRLRRSWRT
jgi:hypothetical protein